MSTAIQEENRPVWRDSLRLRCLASFLVPFLILLYLGLEAGGYDILVRSQLAIIAWWVVLLGLLFGYLPVAGVTRGGWFVIGALLLLAVWAGAGAFTWSDSTERGVIEAARIISLLGFFALFLAIQGRDGPRVSVLALGSAVAVIAAIALTDRFEPGLMPWLESKSLPESYPGARLRFPLDYWNGLAAFLAIGMPALLWGAAEARTVLGRTISAATIPLVGLALYMTFSRGGILEVAAMAIVLVALFPRRLLLLTSAAFPILGIVLLIYLLGKRPEIRDFLPGPEGESQGSEMFLISIGVALGVGFFRYILDRALGTGFVRIPRAGPRVTNAVGVAAVTVSLALVVAGGLTGFFGERWDEFQQVEAGTNTSERIGSLSSSERYFLYDAAVRAFESEPATGIGPGTFEYWWSQEGEGVQFVRDAHSLYLESLAEMGVPGLLLILGLVIGPILSGVRLLLRHGSGEARAALAVCVAGMVAFAAAAAIDWAWELTVLPVGFLLLAAAVTGPGARVVSIQAEASDPGQAPERSLPLRLGAAAFALLAIAAIALPMVGTMLVRDSQEEAREGNPQAALETARRAVAVEPWSATALVQEAQVLGLLERDREAAEVAREATRQEPGNWRNWFVLGETLEPFAARAAARAFDKAVQLRARAERLTTGPDG